MTDPELDQLATLWRQPDPPEEGRIAALAAKARSRARLVGYSDIVLLATCVAMMVVSIPRPTPATLVPGMLIFAALLWINSLRRTGRQMALTLFTADRQSFLEGAIRNARITLRYRMILLGLWVPVMTLAILFKLSARHGGIGPALANVPAWLVSVRGLTVTGFLIASTLWLAFRYRKSLAEIARIDALKRDYEDEEGLERPEAD